MPCFMERKSAFSGTDKGFTLIELIVAMAILALVSSGLLGNFLSSQKKARDSQRKSDLKQLQNALEAFANDHQGRYPDDDGSGNIAACPAPADGGLTGGSCQWGLGEFKMTDGAIYIKKMVEDPKEIDYYYTATADNLGYKLYACLENDQDSDYYEYVSVNCLGCDSDHCTYGVASSNQEP